MLELSQVYGTFANEGGLVRANPLLEVRNQRGERLYQNPCTADSKNCIEKYIFDAATAYQITDILSDNRARTPAFGPQSVLHIPGQEVAVKTGTTNNLRDNWTIGYTSDALVAVWVGNNNNTSMSSIASGITGASPIWNKTIRLLLSETNPHVFAIPDDIVKVGICQTSGTLPCRGCPVIQTEVFRRGTEPQQACFPAQFQPVPIPTPEVLAQ